MLRNMLLLLEATPSGRVAKTLACNIAATDDWHLTGLQIQDAGGTAFEDDFIVSPHSLFLDEFSDYQQYDAQPPLHNSRAGLEDKFFSDRSSYDETKVLTGPKYAVLSQELEKNDLTIIGRDGNFAEQWTHNAKEIINLLLDYRARPIIIAPPDEPQANQNVLLAYDGSPGASRAVQLFVLMGLAQKYNVHALSVSRKKKVARARIDIISRYLQAHGVDVVPHAIDSRSVPQEVINATISQTQSSLVVAGAFGAANWRRNIFGSVSEYLIRYCPVPLFSCQ